MNVKSVRYGVTKNIGNYESERIDVEVEAEGAGFDETLARAKELVDNALGETETKRSKRRIKEALKKGDIETLRELISTDDKSPF